MSNAQYDALWSLESCDNAWATCKRALIKVDDLTARAEHAEAECNKLLELLQDAQYFVPAGLLRDRIDAALGTCE